MIDTDDGVGETDSYDNEYDRVTARDIAATAAAIT